MSSRPLSVPVDTRLPSAERCVARSCLERAARAHPERVFAVFQTGQQWTYAGLLRRVRAGAGALQSLGVRSGDTVSCWLPNGRQALVTLLAVNYLGAVFAPISVEYRGQSLRNAIRAARARVLVVHASLLGRLDAELVSGFEHIVVAGASSAQKTAGRVATEDVGAAQCPTGESIVPEVAAASFLTFEQLERAGREPDDASLAAGPQPWNVHALIATSGTTGPSKFVPITYAQTHATSEGFVALTKDDRALLNIPMSHVGGIGVVFRALYRGGSIAVVEAFSASAFWSTVRELGITTLTLLGAMTDFLLAEPAGPGDRDHPLRHVLMVPIGRNAVAFSERFGVDVYTVFNMTEMSCPIVSERNQLRVGSCGRVRAGYAARLVDANDCEVPRGEVGELILRADTPWVIATEYRDDPKSTAAAWRNGWFHTGDRFRQDEDGYLYFVDRLKDAIRRRGENISASEVEAEIAAYPGVREVAVVGVPSERGEDEVLAAIALVPGVSLDRPGLIGFLADRLPHFMVPRYLRVMDELPKTGSLKVIKQALREAGVTADTWDREAEGLRLRRTRFAGAPGSEASTGRDTRARPEGTHP